MEMPQEVFHVESHDKVKDILCENISVKSSILLQAKGSNNSLSETTETKGVQDSCQELNVSNGMTKMTSTAQKLLR